MKLHQNIDTHHSVSDMPETYIKNAVFTNSAGILLRFRFIYFNLKVFNEFDYSSSENIGSQVLNT